MPEVAMKSLTLPALLRHHAPRAGAASGSAARRPRDRLSTAPQGHRRHPRCSPAADGRDQPDPRRDGPARAGEHANASPTWPSRCSGSPARASTRRRTARTARQTILGITLKRMADGVETKVALPARCPHQRARILARRKVAVVPGDRPNGIELWMADTATARARAVTAATINALDGCDWLEDSSAMLCHFVADRPRAGARAAGRAGGPAHPGEHRQGRSGAHVPGPADERPRRGAVRVLLHVAAGAP